MADQKWKGKKSHQGWDYWVMIFLVIAQVKVSGDDVYHYATVQLTSTPSKPTQNVKESQPITICVDISSLIIKAVIASAH